MPSRTFWSSCLLAVSLLWGCQGALRTPPTMVAREPAWVPWSDAAFVGARRQNKLILISLQADFCHWCHVMNSTTYRDPRVLALLAKHFVVLRADEASRPDLRERYAAWGWPATALLTPDAQPIVNLRGHQPPDTFAPLLSELVDKQRRGQPLGHAVVERAQASASLTEPDALASMRTRVLAQLDSFYDPQQGGWGSPQKYPFAAPVMHSLWRAWYGEPARLKRAVDSLNGYRQLIDPVAGGVYQYSLRGVWTAPHYEKLLSNQAGAIESFSAAYRATHESSFLVSAQRVASYVLSTLRTPEGAFYASQEADVAHVGEPGYLAGASYYAGDARQRARSKAPNLDPHVYADLNGKLIAALTELYGADHDERWLSAAREAAAVVRSQLGRGDAYLHAAPAARDENAADVFYLSDQVEMARALERLSNVGVDPALARARDALVDFCVAKLHDPSHGGFFANTQTAAFGVFSERIKPYDENARLSRLLISRGHSEDDPHWLALARETLLSLGEPDALQNQGRQVGEYLLALEQLEGPYVMFSVVGEADDPRTQALQRAALAAYLPQAIVTLSAPDHSRYPYPGRPAIYLCSENACSSPIVEVERVEAGIAAFVAAAD